MLLYKMNLSVINRSFRVNGKFFSVREVTHKPSRRRRKEQKMWTRTIELSNWLDSCMPETHNHPLTHSTRVSNYQLLNERLSIMIWKLLLNSCFFFRNNQTSFVRSLVSVFVSLSFMTLMSLAIVFFFVVWVFTVFVPQMNSFCFLSLLRKTAGKQYSMLCILK